MGRAFRPRPCCERWPRATSSSTHRRSDRSREGAMGALTGIRVVEMAAIGPVPFCGLMLSDMGAEVVRIDRIGEAHTPFAVDQRKDVIGRGRRSIAVDVKNPAGRELVLTLCAG